VEIGIIQGRLSTPDEGFQECPVNWKKEFETLKRLKLNHIEWIVTKSSFHNNPIFLRDVRSYPVHSICADNVVSTLVDNREFLEHNLFPICEAALRNNIKSVTIPLLEDSSVEDSRKLDNFCNSFAHVCSRYPSINFSLETELSLSKVPSLLSISPNVSLTYDTGNTTSYGISHKEYILSFGDKITNVHIKDRRRSGVSVAPLTGDTNFNEIFTYLAKKGYSGVYTLQTARDSTKKEEETVSNHVKTIRSVYDKCKKSF